MSLWCMRGRDTPPHSRQRLWHQQSKSTPIVSPRILGRASLHAILRPCPVISPPGAIVYLSMGEGACCLLMVTLRRQTYQPSVSFVHKLALFSEDKNHTPTAMDDSCDANCIFVVTGEDPTCLFWPDLHCPLPFRTVSLLIKSGWTLSEPTRPWYPVSRDSESRHDLMTGLS